MIAARSAGLSMCCNRACAGGIAPKSTALPRRSITRWSQQGTVSHALTLKQSCRAMHRRRGSPSNPGPCQPPPPSYPTTGRPCDSRQVRGLFYRRVSGADCGRSDNRSRLGICKHCCIAVCPTHGGWPVDANSRGGCRRAQTNFGLRRWVMRRLRSARLLQVRRGAS
jgi:hypothetical protein